MEVILFLLWLVPAIIMSVFFIWQVICDLFGDGITVKDLVLAIVLCLASFIPAVNLAMCFVILPEYLDDTKFWHRTLKLGKPKP